MCNCNRSSGFGCNANTFNNGCSCNSFNPLVVNPFFGFFGGCGNCSSQMNGCGRMQNWNNNWNNNCFESISSNWCNRSGCECMNNCNGCRNNWCR